MWTVFGDWVLSDDPADWVSWLTLLVSVVVAGAGIAIALSQRRLQRFQLRHELFDRRLLIYQEAQKLVWQIYLEARVSDEDMRHFHVATGLAPFILERTTVEYLKEVSQKARRLLELNSREAKALAHDREHGSEEFPAKRLAEREEIWQSIQWFEAQAPILPVHFARYFQIVE